MTNRSPPDHGRPGSDAPKGWLRSLGRWLGPRLAIITVAGVLGGIVLALLKLQPVYLEKILSLANVPEKWRPFVVRHFWLMCFVPLFAVAAITGTVRGFDAFLRGLIERLREFDPELFRIIRPEDIAPDAAAKDSPEEFRRDLDQVVAFSRDAGTPDPETHGSFRWTFLVGSDPLHPSAAASGALEPAGNLVAELRAGSSVSRLARVASLFRERSKRPWVIVQIKPQARTRISGWLPRRPTLLLLEQPGAGQIEDVLDVLAESSTRFRCPVRLLIVAPDIPAPIRVIRDREDKWRCNRASGYFAPPIGDLVAAPEAAGQHHVKPIYLRYQSSPHFIGRDAFLERLHRRLGERAARAGQSLLIEAIRGMGGVGKTRIAVEYAWRYRDDYSALLFVDAEDPDALRRSLASLAASPLGLAEAALADETLRLAAVRRWLNGAPNWLAIFDNVDSEEALAETITQLGKLSGGVVLVTSRLSRFPDEIHDNPVDLLEPKDAGQYLLNVTEGSTPGAGRRKSADDSELALRLADSLGYLALALVHAGAYIKAERLTLRAYEQLLGTNSSIVLDDELAPYQRTIAATFQTSMDRLRDGRVLLERVAWLAPERIPELLLDVPVPGAELADPRKALRDLDKYSLATRNDDAEAPAFSVHRLVQALARANLPRERLEQRLGEAVKWLGEAMKPAGSVFKGQTSELVPHVLSVLHYLRSDLYRDSETGEFLDPLARLVIFAVLRARSLAEPGKGTDRLIVPEYLISMLGSFYEIEPLSGAIDLLLENHRKEWPTWQTQLLQADNYVLRYAMSVSLSDACIRVPPAVVIRDVVTLLENPKDLNEFELGGYALSMIFAARPDLIGRSAMEGLANRLADREEYSGRSILGDLLLNLVFRGDRDAFHNLRGLVARERFWNPIWDYLKIDVAAFEAAEAFLAAPRRAPTAADRPSVTESYANLESIETDVARLGRTVGRSAALRALLEHYFDLPLDTSRIRNAEADLAERPDLVEFVRLLFRHPIWAVGEAGATVLSTLILKDERHAAIIPTLLADPEWRVRYGAIEAAFARRHQDDRLFLGAVKVHHADRNAKIAGLCAENLASMILNAGREGRSRLMTECDPEIRHWLKSEDCWVLEHVHHLFHALDLRSIDSQAWLAPGASRLFAGEPVWYRLPREAFLKHIERRKVALVAADAVA